MKILKTLGALALAAVIVAGCSGSGGDSIGNKLVKAQSAEQNKDYNQAISLSTEVINDVGATADQITQGKLIFAQSALGQIGFSSGPIITAAGNAVVTDPETGEVQIDTQILLAQIPDSNTIDQLINAADTYNSIPELMALFKSAGSPADNPDILLNAATANVAAALRMFTRQFGIGETDSNAVVETKIQNAFASNPDVWNQIKVPFTVHIINASKLLQRILVINPNCDQTIKDAASRLKPDVVQQQMDKINNAVPADQEGMIIKMLNYTSVRR